MENKKEKKTKKKRKRKVVVKKTTKNLVVKNTKNTKRKSKVAVNKIKNAEKKSSAKSKSAKKAKKNDFKKAENNKNKELYLAEWTASEFIKTNGEILFYYASIIGSILMIIWSLQQGSFIVASTFLIVIVVVIFQIYRQPLNIECKIDLDGIILNGRLHKYDEIDSFEVVQGDDNNALKFKLKNAFLPVKEVQLMDQNPYYIRATLEYFLPERKQKEALLSYEKKGEFGENMSEEELSEYIEYK